MQPLFSVVSYKTKKSQICFDLGGFKGAAAAPVEVPTWGQETEATAGSSSQSLKSMQQEALDQQVDSSQLQLSVKALQHEARDQQVGISWHQLSVTQGNAAGGT